MIEPGICGAPITSSIHWSGQVTEPERLYGKIENPIRHEMEEIAEKAGLDFIVNVVLDENDRIAKYFTGDFRKAFREGASESMRRRVREVTTGRYRHCRFIPSDIDLWQAAKHFCCMSLR
jgi:nickel-dependent lactate racemase